MQKIAVLLIGVLMIFMLYGCSEEDVVDEVVDNVSNVVQQEDENVLAVKNAVNEEYDVTYGEAFENYFGSPKWKYFKGTEEGPDDDEDGKPDYTKENVDVVEFKGTCIYQDVRVEALIQFTLDEETFEATYLAYNKVPQSRLMLAALLESVFNDEDLQDKKTNSGETEEIDTVDDEYTCNLIPGMYKTDDGEDLSISVYTSPEDNYVANMESKKIGDLNGQLEVVDENTYGNRAINEILVHDIKKNEIRYEDGKKVLKVFKLVEKYES